MALILSLRRSDDRTIYAHLAAAEAAGNKALEEAQEDGTLAGTDHRISLTLASGLPWQIEPDEVANAPAGQFILLRAGLTFTGQAKRQQNQSESVSFTFQRANNRENNSLLDTLSLDPGPQRAVMNGAGEQAVCRAMHLALSPLLQPVAPEDGGLIPTLSNLSDAFSTTYQRICDELSAAIQAVSQERTEQINEFQQERVRLGEEISAERDAMRTDMQAEIEAARAEIQAERNELEEEWNKLEISSHKDARRKQFLELQRDLQESLNEPVADGSLRAMRLMVFFALLAAGIVAGIFAYGSIVEGSSLGASGSTLGMLFPAVRSVLLSVASLAGFLGAAAWMRYFYTRDLQSMEELRKFRNDMARASWVMDAALEIRKEHGEEIPPEWIAGVTEGLFAAQKKESLEEGAQALAALMGLSASASFGPQGTSVSFGRSGAKKLAAAAKAEE
ncbi:hypothetical protein BMI86_13155 [Thioclava sp. DLFJ5-1]|uniref:OmpH family outer membrane protein n=1 Tax=Thioclava sp. DLFJ5-1 TaxID=1915314 RepID=UPI000997FF49|nr:OmpH family outer membrane protein [Thioclava sp. DLFJ5-1]OOY19583.1 hypothetical protein BMI86_13155 [Thioclava sp. DLFJ5-1]